MNNYTREGLLRIVEENLSVAMNVPKTSNKRISKVTDFNDVLASQQDRELAIRKVEKAIARIKEAFIAAGLERDFLAVEKSYNGGILHYLTQNEDYDRRGHYHEIEYVELLNHLSDIKYTFLVAITSKLPESESYDPKLMKGFVNEYLSGFIYESGYHSAGIISQYGMQRIEAIYNFYGLTLTDETKEKIIELHLQEDNNHREKKDLGMETERQYYPDILGAFIIQDINNKLKEAATYAETTEEPNNQPDPGETIESEPVTPDEKVETIRKQLAEYDELSKEEREIIAKLEAIRARKKALADKMTGLKP